MQNSTTVTSAEEWFGKGGGGGGLQLCHLVLLFPVLTHYFTNSCIHLTVLKNILTLHCINIPHTVAALYLCPLFAIDGRWRWLDLSSWFAWFAFTLRSGRRWQSSSSATVVRTPIRSTDAVIRLAITVQCTPVNPFCRFFCQVSVHFN